MYLGGGYRIIANKLVFIIYGDVVFVAKMSFLILLGPACIGIFLAADGRIIFKALGNYSCFYLFIFITFVSLSKTTQTPTSTLEQTKLDLYIQPA